MVDPMKYFGSRVREARKIKRLSQDQLAEQLRVDAETVSRWERGVRSPHQRTVAALSDILGKPESWFYPDGQAAHDRGAEDLPAIDRVLEWLNIHLGEAETLRSELAEARAENERLRAMLNVTPVPKGSRQIKGAVSRNTGKNSNRQTG